MELRWQWWFGGINYLNFLKNFEGNILFFKHIFSYFVRANKLFFLNLNFFIFFLDPWIYLVPVERFFELFYVKKELPD
jgi:hypothetical protein